MTKKNKGCEKENPTDFLGTLEREEGGKGLDVIFRLHV